ncbi:hypothetical protein BDBG_16475 [Blastomyces gilchristii SLH14081]|uniref:Uncharacterized protein n=1 Tax=Blastomyces gilchristii (strain SLH14081) TaxID=559298 RepID=A0A179UBP3_BLAGS|nr:uncharacterized protein BDBG_16475 [Blastomyces gilchristii SLH14081]OAT05435.1 hypothetical protein BDBG_16475 [Blastomyces gilchristii SLH14081]
MHNCGIDGNQGEGKRIFNTRGNEATCIGTSCLAFLFFPYLLLCEIHACASRSRVKQFESPPGCNGSVGQCCVLCLICVSESKNATKRHGPVKVERVAAFVHLRNKPFVSSKICDSCPATWINDEENTYCN